MTFLLIKQKVLVAPAAILCTKCGEFAFWWPLLGPVQLKPAGNTRSFWLKIRENGIFGRIFGPVALKNMIFLVKKIGSRGPEPYFWPILAYFWPIFGQFSKRPQNGQNGPNRPIRGSKMGFLGSGTSKTSKKVILWKKFWYCFVIHPAPPRPGIFLSPVSLIANCLPERVYTRHPRKIF